MITLGDYNELTIVKEVEFGIYLDGEDTEILLPKKFVPETAKVGDKLTVFLYRDSMDRLIATMLKPVAKIGECAFLRVKDVNQAGAFLDWGLEKDLFVPFREQKERMKVGDSHVVFIYLDERTDRLAASPDLNGFMEKENIELTENEEVNLIVYRITDLGYSVVINNKYLGVAYHDDVYKNVNIGDKLTGYIKKVRDDKKIDVSLRKFGMAEVDDSKKVILDELQKWGGSLGLSDNSSPDLIKDRLNMSKKTFKKAIGGLYKDGKIELTDAGIKLK